ncbi:MAG: tRNA pseudouridine(55) synthase TruB [Planctomycetaceae bacterium]|nr:tRNA pseudouridine(55) synthase TruB [Planctomycetaceae bacterium]
MATVGLINVNKPAGLTSRDVVDRVARVTGQKKAGHAGTLDPMATGVLVVCLGWCTRLIEYVQGRPKRYRATFVFGQSSPSDDRETEVTLAADLPHPTRAQIDRVLPEFQGEIMQRPPAYSALKINGKRAYHLARKGREVDLEPRPVHVYEQHVVRYDFPELVLDIACGQGTYVRSLGRDLAERLGTVALMSALERTSIGSFAVEEACPWAEVEREHILKWLSPPRRAIADMPTITVDDDDRAEIALGRPIISPPLEVWAHEYAALDAAGTLLGVMAPDQPGRLRVVRSFCVEPCS